MTSEPSFIYTRDDDDVAHLTENDDATGSWKMEWKDGMKKRIHSINIGETAQPPRDGMSEYRTLPYRYVSCLRSLCCNWGVILLPRLSRQCSPVGPTIGSSFALQEHWPDFDEMRRK